MMEVVDTKGSANEAQGLSIRR